jgi:hypothetical protein
MPEVFQEAEELRQEIVRLRPEWLAQGADLTLGYQLKGDWQGAWWRRARRTPASEAHWIHELGGDNLAMARQVAREQRHEALDKELTFHGILLEEVNASYPVPVPGWDGLPFEAWRAESLSVWWQQLFRPRSAHLDWLGPWLNLPFLRADHASWVRFWSRDVQTEALPLAWLRWAFSFVQSTRKTTPGTPVDNQISTYLPGADVFVTCDRAFADCVDRVRPLSPFKLATCRVLPAGPEAVPALLALIEETRREHRGL